MATYYVSNLGSDSNDGLSTGAPWLTITKVNATVFSPGDNILFRCGDTWTGTLIPEQSGTYADRITFGNYGAGESPIITTRDSLTNWNNAGSWTSLGGNKWSIAFSGFINFIHRIWLNGSEYGMALNAGAVDSTWRFFVDAPATTITVYATSNPATFYTNIEIAASETLATVDTLEIYDESFIIFSGIDFQGGGYKTISLNGANYIDFEYCNIGKYSNHMGIIVEEFGVNPFSNYCTVKNCVLDSDSIIVYPSTAQDKTVFTGAGISLHNGANGWDISRNNFKSWNLGAVVLESHTSATPCSFNKVHHNIFDGGVLSYCRGYSTFGQAANCVSYNEFHHNTHINMKGAPSQIGGDYNICHHDIIDTVTSPNGRVTGEGFSLAPWGDNADFLCAFNKILNCTIVDCVHAGIHLADLGDETDLTHDNEISNNIIVNCEYLIRMEADAHVLRTTYRNNILYKDGVTNSIYYHDNAISVATFNTETVNGDVISGNLAVDPLFITDSFYLQAGSPALDAGVTLFKQGRNIGALGKRISKLGRQAVLV